MKTIVTYIIIVFFFGYGLGACIKDAIAADTTINYKGQPVPSAMAPSMSAFSQD